jgi:hypothetical protein
VSISAFLAVVFAVALAVEWRYGYSTVRISTALLALLVLFLALPNYTGARRWAVVAPPHERVTELHGSVLSDYRSGVYTMSMASSHTASRGMGPRFLAVGVLFWLACSPAIRSGGPVRRRLYRFFTQDVTEQDVTGSPDGR